jgi:ATP-dependent protease HslVU (ClpYQ) peptidase subunit
LKEAQETLTQLSYSLVGLAPKIKDAHAMFDNLQGSLEKSGENLAKQEVREIHSINRFRISG